MDSDRTALGVLADLDPERVLRTATPEEGTARRVQAVALMAITEELYLIRRALERQE